MAITATLFRFQIELADIDRSVYETLDLRVACHPSEDHERMVVRVLARAIAHQEGLEFGRGLSHTEDPALFVRSPHGDIHTWIDIGIPTAERLHRSSKASDSLMVFTNKHDAPMRKEWSSRSVHRAETIEIVRLPTDLVSKLADQLDRNNKWYVTLQEGALSVADGERSIDGAIERISLADFLSSAP